MVFKKQVKSDNDAHNGDIQGNYNPAYETTDEEFHQNKPDNNAKKIITIDVEKGVARVEVNNDVNATETPAHDISEIEKHTKDHKRPTWGNGVEFLMSCISLSVGIGNIWRFPFTAYENGGGAFVIPYLIVLVVIGRPMYYLEMAIGQFVSKGHVKIWELAPFMKGIGIGQTICLCFIVSYYAVILAIAFHYLVASFSTTLPWATCLPEWGSNCVDSVVNKSTMALDALTTNATDDRVSSSELYFNREVLHEKDSIVDGIGLPSLSLTFYLFISWTLVFLVMVKGVKSSGKASYFLALFPYVILFTLLAKAITLDGAWDGIKFFLTPQWDQLVEPRVWRKAVEQCFFSLSVALGPIFMFSSYNRFDHNIYRDAAIVSIMDTFTSLLAGITVFGILGSLAATTGKEIKNVIKDGAGLAFISYPDAIAKFEHVPQFFSVLFFVMLLTLGIGSCVGMHAAAVTAVWDHYPKQKYWKFALGGCIIGFLSGLVYVTPGGQWMLTLVDEYGSVFLVLGLAIFEIVTIMWIYGLENICLDIEFMTKRRIGFYWRICWGIITPLCMIFLFVYALIKYENPTYADKLFPDEYYVIGWCLFLIGIIQVPVWFFYLLAHRYENDLFETYLAGLKPSPKWGPKALNNKLEWMKFKQDKLEQRRNFCEINNFSRFRERVHLLLGL
ncbi:sodium-dependent nutrient amino acid transporter 1-like [Culicoides brevitarsis]|uniref:sodium-dependent nutrient amino acid transporter 1-like n=1 Tax=Culicoides brevitarsis TaxID=469753 RepID=UPI00307B22D8